MLYCSDEEVESLINTLVGSNKQPTLKPILPLHHKQVQDSAHEDFDSMTYDDVSIDDRNEDTDPTKQEAVVIRKPPSQSRPSGQAILPTEKRRAAHGPVGGLPKLIPKEISPSCPETKDDGIKSEQHSTQPALHLNEKKLPEEGKDEKIQKNTNSSESRSVSPDFEVEQGDDELVVEDPRKSKEITDWTDSWAKITGGGTPGKYKRPIRRDKGKFIPKRNVTWAEHADKSVSEKAPANKAVLDSEGSEKTVKAVPRNVAQSSSSKGVALKPLVVERAPTAPSSSVVAVTNPTESANLVQGTTSAALDDSKHSEAIAGITTLHSFLILRAHSIGVFRNWT